MCYACEEGTSRAEVLRPGRRHVVIAPDAFTFRRYCRENDLHWITPPAIFIRTDDASAGRYLHGLQEFEIHRVDGALAMEAVERMLDHMLAVRLAREVRAATPTVTVVDEAAEYWVDSVLWSQARLATAANSASPTLADIRNGRELSGWLPYADGDTVPETAMRAPHHWASRLERSPYWNRAAEVLMIPTGDTILTYTRDELEEDIRYV